MEPLKKSAQVATDTTNSTGQGQAETSIPLWQRQPGEPLLWFNRFKLFRNLGYKRTLLAALLKERETLSVLKSTEAAPKSDAPKPKRGRTRISAPAPHLQEVPKPPPTQAPGSWKQASIKYHWVERAAAYDEYRIDRMVEQCLDDLMENAGTTFHRVMMLKQLLELMRTNLNKNIGTMTTEQIIAWLARMQSIMRDIREEMRGYDEHVTRVILQRQSTKIYQDYEPKPKEQPVEQTYEKLVASAGGDREKLLAEIRREQAKRRREGL